MQCSGRCLLNLVLMLFYFCISSTTSQSVLPDPPPYMSYAGKTALETTIQLPELQYKFSNGSGADVERRDKVKEVIKRTWDLYVQQAWGWDEVRPVRGSGQDPRYSLPTWMLTRKKWLGCDNCRRPRYFVHCRVKRGTGICIGLHRCYRLHISRRFCWPVRDNYPVGSCLLTIMSRYVGGLVSICDLLEYSSDESPFQAERIDSIRHQAQVLASKLSPGYVHVWKLLTTGWNPRQECGFQI